MLVAFIQTCISMCIFKAPPYVIGYKENGKTKYKGLAIDILKKLSLNLKFNYIIEEVPDRVYGVLTNGVWNGLIRRLIDKVEF